MEKKSNVSVIQNVSECCFPLIEKALGFELHENQKCHLRGDAYFYHGRAAGRTTAYCIKLALSSGDPLDVSRPEHYADMQGELSGYKTYARRFFLNEFMDIREKLKDIGFDVRDVTNRREVELCDFLERYTGEKLLDWQKEAIKAILHKK